MKLYTYIVARDYGFAPNPFHGFCTLATCKPRIRSVAAIGDWVVGTGAKTKYNCAGQLVYTTQVSEVMNFDDYWNDPRFLIKRPVLNGSLMQVYGDNIYHREGGDWIQANSHHSLDEGHPNRSNIDRDTDRNRILIGTHFVYFGASAPVIPDEFRPFRSTNEDLCCDGIGYRVHGAQLAVAFERWLKEQGRWGLQGLPLEFINHPRHQR